MRIPEYLSPSALGVWRVNTEKYFLQYLADNRPPRYPQTEPMSVGSAFDAYVKCYIHDAIFGKGNEQFDLDSLMTTQVESQNLDFAWKAGREVMEMYTSSGALRSLMSTLSKAKDIRMEFTAQQDINGVPLLGKPDLSYVLPQFPVTHDWKVNGYCSKASPVGGYIDIRAITGRVNGPHKDAYVMFEGDFAYNSIPNLEVKQHTWAVQLATYGWITGVPVGGKMMTSIDQIAWGDKPRVAQHRCEITPDFQISVFNEYKALWDIIQSGHIFRQMTREKSDERCETLSAQAAIFEGDSPKAKYLRKMTGRGV
jgi:hypothetical protein